MVTSYLGLATDFDKRITASFTRLAHHISAQLRHWDYATWANIVNDAEDTELARRITVIPNFHSFDDNLSSALSFDY